MNKEIPEKKNRSTFSKISFSRHPGCNENKIYQQTFIYFVMLETLINADRFSVN